MLKFFSNASNFLIHDVVEICAKKGMLKNKPNFYVKNYGQKEKTKHFVQLIKNRDELFMDEMQKHM